MSKSRDEVERTTGEEGVARESATALTAGAAVAAAGGAAGILVGAMIGGLAGFLVGMLLGNALGESKGFWRARGGKR